MADVATILLWHSTRRPWLLALQEALGFAGSEFGFGVFKSALLADRVCPELKLSQVDADLCDDCDWGNFSFLMG